ncbi:unnamed protein product [Ilex paraguariensis]
MFAILVIMALFTTFMTTPMVMAIYRPARNGSSAVHRQLQKDLSHSKRPQNKLRVLACVRGFGNSTSLINLIETTRSTKKFPMKLYVMHLVELTDRSSSIVMVHRSRKNGLPFVNRFHQGDSHDQVAAAFDTYSQLGRVTVQPTTAISALSTMHEDICHVAKEKTVAMIILPFHKQWRREGEEEAEINVGYGWRGVNERVLKNAPCSVAVLVDRGFGAEFQQISGVNANLTKRVCLVFLGGPDDREALELGGRMAEHPTVRVTILRFVEKTGLEDVIFRAWPSSSNDSAEERYSFPTTPKNNETDKEVDEAALVEFRRRWAEKTEYAEKVVRNITEEVLQLGQSREYELLIVGNGRFPTTIAAKLRDHLAEHAELGPLGDLLASSGQGVVCSVLVIQQHDPVPSADKAPGPKIVRCKDDAVTANESSV